MNLPLICLLSINGYRGTSTSLIVRVNSGIFNFIFHFPETWLAIVSISQWRPNPKSAGVSVKDRQSRSSMINHPEI